jgi:hypothetical protein
MLQKTATLPLIGYSAIQLLPALYRASLASRTQADGPGAKRTHSHKPPTDLALFLPLRTGKLRPVPRH